MPFDFGKQDAVTDDAILSPQVGDYFTEMYAFELFVVHIDGDTIATLECTRSGPFSDEKEPVTMPRDGILRVQTKDEFRARLSYSSRDGYWVDLVERGFNVDGWYEYAVSASDK